MDNPSKLQPVEFKVLVKPDKVDEMSGPLFVPAHVRDKMQLAEIKSTLVAAGGNAFEDWSGARPAPGDRVYIAKYAGLYVKGEDGEEYRLCNDKDIVAIIDEAKE